MKAFRFSRSTARWPRAGSRSQHAQAPRTRSGTPSEQDRESSYEHCTTGPVRRRARASACSSRNVAAAGASSRSNAAGGHPWRKNHALCSRDTRYQVARAARAPASHSGSTDRQDLRDERAAARVPMNNRRLRWARAAEGRVTNAVPRPGTRRWRAAAIHHAEGSSLKYASKPPDPLATSRWSRRPRKKAIVARLYQSTDLRVDEIHAARWALRPVCGWHGPRRVGSAPARPTPDFTASQIIRLRADSAT
jgi:hypothetical protein